MLLFNKTHVLTFLLLLILHPPPSCTVAQSGDAFKPNTGDFAPSTIIIIIIGVIFLLSGFLAVFLRQFSDGCFGLNVVSINPGVTADCLPVASGLDAEAIKSLPTYFYSDVKQHRKGEVELECPVCLSEFLDQEALRLLRGCNHVFHPRCIDPWLSAHVTCPICRQNLESGSRDPLKPCSFIDIPDPTTQSQTEESDGPDQPKNFHRRDYETDCVKSGSKAEEEEDEKEMKKIVGKFPRSHSTGHSIASSERFTLKLSEEVQSSLVDRSSHARASLTSMVLKKSNRLKLAINAPGDFFIIHCSFFIVLVGANSLAIICMIKTSLYFPFNMAAN